MEAAAVGQLTGVDNLLPARNLLSAVDTRNVPPSTSTLGDEGRLSDEERTRVGRALAVVLGGDVCANGVGKLASLLAAEATVQSD